LESKVVQFVFSKRALHNANWGNTCSQKLHVLPMHKGSL